MKKILFMASAGLLLASCASDEVVNMTSENEIQFAPAVGNPTRATDVFCSNNPGSSFNVWAYVDGKEYINGDEITLEGTTWTNATAKRYWPANEVTFYGVKNGELTWASDITKAPTVSFTVKENVGEQEDLLYARTPQTKDDDASPVTLNFRHALAQVVFEAKNVNPQLHVEIESVSVVNAVSEGTYNLPTDNTDATYVDHGPDNSGMGDNKTLTNNTTGSRGSWTVAENAAVKSYTVDVKQDGAAVSVDATEEGATAVKLTSANDADKEFSSKALLLIPQDYTSKQYDGGKSKAENNNAVYFKVKCKITNVAGEKYSAEKDVVLWADTDGSCKDLILPAELNWAEGKKYVYTFVFGQGGGGYDPDPDQPKPVLVPITYTCTVDDFIYGDSKDVEDKDIN